MTSQKEKDIRLVFVISLTLKGIFALAETTAGIATYLISIAGSIFSNFLPQQFVMNLVQTMTREELTEDPRDFVANYLIQTAHTLSVSTLNFAALYLLIHGIVKLWLVIGLLRKKLWYCPTALIVFGAFVIYQLYRYTLTHSIFLLLITAIDLIVIGLTWHEYRYLKTTLKPQVL